MTTKENAYAHLVEAIKDCDDEALLRKRPDQWRHVRRVDDFLVKHREDEAIPDTVYEKGCQTIIDYYITEKPQ